MTDGDKMTGGGAWGPRRWREGRREQGAAGSLGGAGEMEVPRPQGEVSGCARVCGHKVCTGREDYGVLESELTFGSRSTG